MNYVDSCEEARVILKMPLFTVEHKTLFKNILKNLGMKLVFNNKKTDFSGISNSKSLCIDDILQNCVIKVDEEGVEAAALTAITAIGRKTVPKDVRKLYLNKPFLFAITENNGNFILFIGKIMNPLN